MSKSRFDKFVLTYAAGVLTGAILALLFTPMTGKKMQRKVSDVADKVIDTVDEVHKSIRNIARA